MATMCIDGVEYSPDVSAVTREYETEEIEWRERLPPPQFTTPLTVRGLVEMFVARLGCRRKQKTQSATSRSGVLRPFNPFWIWLQQIRAEGMLNPDKKNWATIASGLWKLLSAVEREYYGFLAKLYSTLHRLAHPDYKYEPQRAEKLEEPRKDAHSTEEVGVGPSRRKRASRTSKLEGVRSRPRRKSSLPSENPLRHGSFSPLEHLLRPATQPTSSVMPAHLLASSREASFTQYGPSPNSAGTAPATPYDSFLAPHGLHVPVLVPNNDSETMFGTPSTSTSALASVSSGLVAATQANYLNIVDEPEPAYCQQGTSSAPYQQAPASESPVPQYTDEYYGGALRFFPDPADYAPVHAASDVSQADAEFPDCLYPYPHGPAARHW